MADDQGSAGVREAITLEKFEGDPLDGVLLETVTIDASTGSVTVQTSEGTQRFASPEEYAAARDGS